MLILIAQKKRPGALNTTQKTPALCNVPFLNKSRTAKIAHFLEVFLLRYIQYIRTLLLSYQNLHFDNFSKFPSQGGTLMILGG